MFVQVIRGKVRDASALRDALEQWLAELAPGAKGWLGSTTGVADDGSLVGVARFDSEEDARRYGDRPEHRAWWATLKQAFEGEVSVENSVDVDAYVVGDPGTAGFVQVVQGTVTDPARAHAVMSARPANFDEIRPDILAVLQLTHDAGRWTTVAYFTSEAEARERESGEQPPEFTAMMQELGSLTVGEITYTDLRQLWFASPGPDGSARASWSGSMAGSS